MFKTFIFKQDDTIKNRNIPKIRVATKVPHNHMSLSYFS